LSTRAVGEDGNDALSLGELAEVRETRHVVGVLILTVQKNHDWIMLLFVIALGQMHGKSSRDVIHIDLFLRLLRPQRNRKEQQAEAEKSCARLSPRAKRRSHFGD
jgi:hypothetical protein